MSHELLTPLNGIMGMTDLALRRATDPKQIDQLGKVRQSSQRLLAIIRNVLDIAQLEADRITLKPVEFKIPDVLESLASLFGQEARNKELQLVIDSAPELTDVSVQGDASRLGQILHNLVGNAIKFTEKGTIGVRAALVEEDSRDVDIRFEVRDTGIGISDEHQKRVFDSFQQADGSMTRKYGGTGVGLAISKHLVTLLGGSIGVQSQAGEGSTFWFTARFIKSARLTA